jgi:hypothetical protein
MGNNDLDEDGRFMKRVKAAKATKGRNCLIKFLGGERLTRKEAISAKCCRCMGLYSDGVRDCEDRTCPIHPLMDYNVGNDRYIRKYRRV